MLLAEIHDVWQLLHDLSISLAGSAIPSTAAFVVIDTIDSLSTKATWLLHPLHHSGECYIPDSKVHGANMGPTWGWQDPGGPHVGHMNLVIWDNLYPTGSDIYIESWENQAKGHVALMAITGANQLVPTHLVKSL